MHMCVKCSKQSFFHYLNSCTDLAKAFCFQTVVLLSVAYCLLPPTLFLFDVAFQDKCGIFPAIARFPSERRGGCVRSTSTDNQPILPGLPGEGEADPLAVSVCIWPLGTTTCPPRLSAPYWLCSSPCKKRMHCVFCRQLPERNTG